jgi:hypothetical protein
VLPPLGDYGLIGRDGPLLLLERALRGRPAGILIHGMAGAGKTTLANGFLRWLEESGGLGEGVFWFSFEEIRSAEYVLNMLASEFFGTNVLALSVEEKLNGLVKFLYDHPYILVWDNFESASGITETDARLSSDDREVLRRLLQGLRDGKTKVIITSRTNEEWLSHTECRHLKELEGLEGEELWAYCNAVVSDLGLSIQRDDEDFQKLIEKLDDNPLAIRAILLRLADKSAQKLLEELDKQFEGYSGDESTKRLTSTWALLEDAFNARLEPILQLIGLHEYMLNSSFLEIMLKEAAPDLKPVDIADCLNLLMRAGQCSRHRQNETLYHLHPALHGYLNERHHAPEEMQRVFVNAFSKLADILVPKELYEQQPSFKIHAANLSQAKRLATELNAGEEELALLQSLAVYAQNSRSFNEAKRLFTEQADRAKSLNVPEWAAPAYHQLGRVAQERRDFDAAEGWYEKSLEI